MAYIEKYGHGGDLLTARQLFRKDSTQLLDFSFLVEQGMN